MAENENENAEATEVATVTVQDVEGNDMEVEVGVDGVNPVSPNNPPAKAEGAQAVLEQQQGIPDDERNDSTVPVTGDGEGGAGGDGSEEPAGNASRDAWVAYAKSKGATDEDLEGMGRDDIRDTYES